MNNTGTLVITQLQTMKHSNYIATSEYNFYFSHAFEY